MVALTPLHPMPTPPSSASSVSSPENPFVKRAEFLIEPDAELSLAQANESGLFHEKAVSQLSFGFGIASRPVWVHLEILNPSEALLPVNLITSASWNDHLEGYVVSSPLNSVANIRWRSGDELTGAEGLVPAIGYVQRLALAPGRHDVYLRAHSVDPLVLPLELVSDTQFRAYERGAFYSYGFLYGFLVAMVFYYALLFARVRERSYLYYVGYLASLLLCNISYTGHGFALLWPNAITFQRYVILVLMMCVSSLGLLFAKSFLDLDLHSPRIARTLTRAVIVSVAAMALCVAFGTHAGAAYVAFSCTFLFSLSMVPLGLLSLRYRKRASHQFLAAALCGSVGIALTTLAVWGQLPYSKLLYRSLDFGIMFEAVLWGYALASRIRDQQVATVKAKEVSLTDPLTSLRNRRGFLEQVTPVWERAVLLNRPLTVVMIDIDHFKRVNDEYGHAVGDAALVGVVNILLATCRGADVAARWGGEEFIVLLPETNQEQARIFAERARGSIESTLLSIPHLKRDLSVTASFGIAQRTTEMNLHDLVEQADQQLYEAKKNGRNRISDNGAAPALVVQAEGARP
jgi:two-component system, sensor histidine kinase LadS